MLKKLLSLLSHIPQHPRNIQIWKILLVFKDKQRRLGREKPTHQIPPALIWNTLLFVWHRIVGGIRSTGDGRTWRGELMSQHISWDQDKRPGSAYGFEDPVLTHRRKRSPFEQFCAFLCPMPRHLCCDTPCNYKRGEKKPISIISTLTACAHIEPVVTNATRRFTNANTMASWG